MSIEFFTENNNFTLSNSESILSDSYHKQFSVLGELLPTNDLSQPNNAAFSEMISSSKLEDIQFSSDLNSQQFIRIEAETMTLNGYGVESASVASKGKLISLIGKGNTGTASTSFTGPAGTYNVVVGYYDENDGVAQLSMKTDGKQIDFWNLDRNLGSDYISTGNLVERKVANISLKQGSKIEIQGRMNATEYARVDYIDLIPVATSVPPKTPVNQDITSQTSIRMEAENMTLNGYGVESASVASKGKLISLIGKGNTGTASTSFTGPTGTYNVVVGYYDENDGVAQLSMKTDGKQIDFWNLDRNLGSDYISTGNLVERKIANISLKQGSKIEIEGKMNATEYARVDYIDFIPVATSVPPQTPTPVDSGPVRAFPGAEGFGANAIGGRGGNVIFVTNLNDSGAGSLRAALEASGSRTVVFQTGGTITLNSSIKINNPYITIAGQTAPGGGIAIKTSGTFDGAPIVINTHDVIVRHLRVRPGAGPAGTSTTPSTDAIQIKGGRDIIFDHCSLSWAQDEIFDSWGRAQNITVQRSILSEGLNQGHAKGNHSAGALMGYGTDKVTMYGNLFAHNWMRNPWMKTDIKGTTATYQFVNNVIYNWGYHGTQIGWQDGLTQANVIGNYYKPGKNYDKSLYNEIMAWDNSKVYVKGNIGPRRPNDSMDEWQIVGGWAAQAPTSRRSMTPFNAPNLPVLSASEAYQTVLQEAGATRPGRDAVDQRVINDVRNGTGSIIDNPSQVGGWPNLSRGTASADTDKDGMPDAWEVQNGLNPNNPNDRNGKINGNGYTNLERYLNSIA